MKKIYFLIILILSYQSISQANEDIFEFDKIVLIEKDDAQKYRIRTFYDGEVLAYTLNNTFTKNDSSFFDIYFVDDSAYSKSFFIPDSISYKNLFISDFYITDSLIICLDLMNILIYDRFSYKLLNSIHLTNTYLYVTIIDNKIYCYNDISSSGNLNLYSRLYLTKYSLSGIQEQFHIFNEVNGIDFTYLQPRKIIDVSDTFTIISDVTNYNIYVYNNRFELIDSLKREPIHWIQNDSLNVRLVNRLQPKADFQKCLELKNTQSMIERIYFVDYDKIFVTWSSPTESENKREFFIDLWKFENGKWIIDKIDIVDLLPNALSQFNYNNFNLGYKKYSIKKGYLISIEDIPFVINPEYLKKSFSDIQDSITSFLQTNGMHYSILIRKIK